MFLRVNVPPLEERDLVYFSAFVDIGHEYHLPYFQRNSEDAHEQCFGGVIAQLCCSLLQPSQQSVPHLDEHVDFRESYSELISYTGLHISQLVDHALVLQQEHRAPDMQTDKISKKTQSTILTGMAEHLLTEAKGNS